MVERGQNDTALPVAPTVLSNLTVFHTLFSCLANVAGPLWLEVNMPAAEGCTFLTTLYFSSPTYLFGMSAAPARLAAAELGDNFKLLRSTALHLQPGRRGRKGGKEERRKKKQEKKESEVIFFSCSCWRLLPHVEQRGEPASAWRAFRYTALRGLPCRA